jgi:hypothetical protein
MSKYDAVAAELRALMAQAAAIKPLTSESSEVEAPVKTAQDSRPISTAVSPSVKPARRRFDAVHEQLFKGQESIADYTVRRQTKARELRTGSSKPFLRAVSKEPPSRPLSKPSLKNDRSCAGLTHAASPPRKVARKPSDSLPLKQEKAD